MIALTAALSIPGMCSALERDDHWSGQNEYKDWFNRYLAKKFKFLTADDCYGLRCGIVHKGTSGIKPKGEPYKRVVFTLPRPDGNAIIHGLVDEVLIFDSVQFCLDIISSSEEWHYANKDNEIVLRNSKDVFSYMLEGLSPYVSGTPIIA